MASPTPRPKPARWSDRFSCWFFGEVAGDPDVIKTGKRTFDRRWMRAHLADLRDRVLCCPGPGSIDQRCHGDELWNLANNGTMS